jgi:hypothetical protein
VTNNFSDISICNKSNKLVCNKANIWSHTNNFSIADILIESARNNKSKVKGTYSSLDISGSETTKSESVIVTQYRQQEQEQEQRAKTTVSLYLCILCKYEIIRYKWFKKKRTNSKSKNKDNYKSVICTSLSLSLFLSLFLFNNSTTRKYISKESITLCQSGGDETSIDDLWPVSQPRLKL